MKHSRFFVDPSVSCHKNKARIKGWLNDRRFFSAKSSAQKKIMIIQIRVYINCIHSNAALTPQYVAILIIMNKTVCDTKFFTLLLQIKFLLSTVLTQNVLTIHEFGSGSKYAACAVTIRLFTPTTQPQTHNFHYNSIPAVKRFCCFFENNTVGVWLANQSRPFIYANTLVSSYEKHELAVPLWFH